MGQWRSNSRERNRREDVLEGSAEAEHHGVHLMATVLLMGGVVGVHTVTNSQAHLWAYIR